MSGRGVVVRLRSPAWGTVVALVNVDGARAWVPVPSTFALSVGDAVDVRGGKIVRSLGRR